MSLSTAGKQWIEKHGYWTVSLSVCVFALALIYWRIVRGYIPPVSYVPWGTPPGWVQTLYVWRWVVRAVQVLVGGVLLYFEWFDQTVSRWLRAMLENRATAVTLTVAIGLLLGSYLLQPGNFASGDASVQRSSSWVVWKAIKDGQWFVFWTNYAYLGSPFSQFHGSIYYYLAAFVNLFTRDFYDATEIVLLVLHAASAIPMYLYVRQLTGSRPAGLVAAIAWSATFYRYHLIVVLGKLPYSLFVGLWPMQFYLIEKLTDDAHHSRRLWAGLALTVGVMIWTHVLYGAWAIALGVFYALMRSLFPLDRSKGSEILKRLVTVISAHGFAVLTALHPIVPTLIESRLTGMGGYVGARHFSLPRVALENVLVFKGSYLTDWFGGFVGNTIVGVAVLAVVVILATRYLKALPLAGQLAVTLFMTFAPHYWPAFFDTVFRRAPLGNFAYAAKSPGIYLVVTIGPAAALVGVFAQALTEAIDRRRPQALLRWLGGAFMPERLSLATAIIVLAELVPLTLWVSIKYPDDYVEGMPGRQPIMAALTQADDKTARVVDVGAGVFGTYAIPMLTGHPSLFGHWEESPGSTGTLVRLVELLSSDMAAGRLSLEATELLYQLDIGYLITSGEARPARGDLEEVIRTETAVLWRVRHHAPMVAASAPANDNSVVVKVPQRGDGLVNVRRYVATSAAVTLDFSLPQPAFVQVAYTAYPYQKVTLDGRRIVVTPTALGLIGFWADAGEHTVTITPELSSLRRWTLGVSAVTALVVVAVLLFPAGVTRRWRRDKQ